MLEDLQAVQLQNAVRPGMRVVEAWAVDCPNHGESGKVNDVELRDKPGLTSEWHDFFSICFVSES